MEAKPERLQKILAAAGLASRRKAEELIEAGVVSVNGEIVTEKGTKADPRIDEIRVDGKLLRGPERHVYLAVYKPKGYVTTVRDPEGRPTVMDLLKGIDERVFPVGRLDYMSEGLLLLTNDGELMAKLTSAGSKVAKTYMVKVAGMPTEEEIEKLRNGIMLPPEPGLTGARGKKQPGVERRSFAVLTQPAHIQLAVSQENPWFEVTLTEGRNRQIRRMFEQIGHHIEKIKRVRYGSLTLDVEPGEFRHLTAKEVTLLRKAPDTPFKPKPLKAKPVRGARKFDGAERAPRLDAARFVKGRRGKPAELPQPAVPSIPAEAAPEAPAPRREFATKPAAPRESKRFGEKRNFEKKIFGEKRSFGERKPYEKKPRSFAAGEEGSEHPKRAYAPRTDRPFTPRPQRDSGPERGEFRPRGPEFKRERPAAGFGERPPSASSRQRSDTRPPSASSRQRSDTRPPRKQFGAASGRSGSDRPRPSFPKREGGLAGKREGSFQKREGGFSKFAKPARPRGEGESFERRPLREGKPFGERPTRPSSFGAFDRKSSRGPGKPAAAGAGEERRSFTPREGRPGGFEKRPGKSFGEGRPARSGFGEKRAGGGFGEKRPSFGARPAGGSRPSGGRPSGGGKPGGFSKFGKPSGFGKKPGGSRPGGPRRPRP